MGRSGEARFGLCASCRHQRLVANTRGSRFSLCERSREDPAFVKYPRMPVVECAGWQPIERPVSPNAPFVRP